VRALCTPIRTLHSLVSEDAAKLCAIAPCGAAHEKQAFRIGEDAFDARLREGGFLITEPGAES